MTHLQNGDFFNERIGWTLDPAAEETIHTSITHFLGRFEGRYAQGKDQVEGETLLR